MTTYEKRVIECMICVDQFGKKPGLVLTPTETTHFASVATNLAAARDHGADQVSGRSGYREGAAERQSLAADIYNVLRRMSDMAKSMEEEGNVGAKERFRLPAKPTYEALLAVADSFKEKAAPMAATFVARGFAATFLDDLGAKVTALGSASGVKVEGAADQVAGTAGLDHYIREGLKAVRILRPMMREHLKDDPALLAAWNGASRVARSAPKESGDTPPPPVPPAGS